MVQTIFQAFSSQNLLQIHCSWVAFLLQKHCQFYCSRICKLLNINMINEILGRGIHHALQIANYQSQPSCKISLFLYKHLILKMLTFKTGLDLTSQAKCKPQKILYPSISIICFKIRIQKTMKNVNPKTLLVYSFQNH